MTLFLVDGTSVTEYRRRREAAEDRLPLCPDPLSRLFYFSSVFVHYHLVLVSY